MEESLSAQGNPGSGKDMVKDFLFPREGFWQTVR